METTGAKTDLTFRRQNIRRIAKSLDRAARFVQVYAFVHAIAAAIIGIVLIQHEADLADYPYRRHDLVVPGVSALIGGVVSAILIWAVARALQLYALTSIAVHSE